MAETPQTSYAVYQRFVDEIVTSENLSNFKSDTRYTYMLEHVSKEQGLNYLILLQEIFTFETIYTFCILNDSLGTPTKYIYNNLVCSPTSLRYLYHAHLALKELEKNKLNDIVEIGGGYGGLYLAINFLYKKYDVKINSYYIIDLPPVIKLQQLYTSKFNTEIKLFVHESTLFGSNIDKNRLFLISNYCFSEIPREIQRKYIDTLFPKVSHGFIVWNHIYTYNFGFSYTEEEEIPYTGLKFNKFIRF
jgi:putative sugar O-methyltransferase